MMASTTYQYEPLTSESSFRILRLLTAHPGFAPADTIEIELWEADFARPPVFEAISYAWGQEEANAIITCNSLPLRVTPNVLSILTALLQRPDSSRLLWIDSICINQTSVAERNMQVPRMRSIYSQAARVWVWLGEGSFELDIAFDFILEVNDIIVTAGTSKAMSVPLIQGADIFHCE
jgi:hypothetical protein